MSSLSIWGVLARFWRVLVQGIGQVYVKQVVARFHLYAKKVDPATIARQVGISQQSVYAYLKMKEPPARTRIHRQDKPLIDPYKEYLVKRWNKGCRNAQLVSREIKAQGYTGSDQPIARFFAQFRQKKTLYVKSQNRERKKKGERE